MKHSHQRIGALFVIGLTISISLYLLNRRPESAATIQLVQMPGGDLTALVSSVHEHIGVVGWPEFSATSVDVVHAHGSPAVGEALALRLNGIRIDASTLRADATGDQMAGGLFDFFQDHAESPQWLKTPWIDSDGSFADWGSATPTTPTTPPNARFLWYVRPHAQELILYLVSNDLVSSDLVSSEGLAISEPMKSTLASASYERVTSARDAGDDWLEWARLRLSPMN